MNEKPPFLIGERVLWLGSGSGLPKGGKVKWIGRLPEMGPDWAVGLELDEALPYGGIDGTWRRRKLFVCQHKHGLIVPRSSIILQPLHTLDEALVTVDLSGNVKRSSSKGGSHEHPTPKSQSKVSKLIRALSSDESADYEKTFDLELPSTHLRNRNLERQLAILGTLRRSGTLESGRLEGVKSEACLYSVILEKEENVFRERRRMINGREFKRSEGTLDRTSSIISSRSGNSKKDRSSGIFSFFRWFKKEKYDDSELDSPPSPSSPELGRQDYSITGSVDTLFSTATARSFAFVSPSHYRPFGAANPPELRIYSEPETNTYKNRIHQRDILRRKEKHITLKEKYNLHSGETLPRGVDDVNGTKKVRRNDFLLKSNDNSIPKRKRRAPPPPPDVKTDSISETSLPAVLSIEYNPDRQHRRTLSEPSQPRDPKPCHRKGKRRAPPPPLILTESLAHNNTLSLQRKKRPAPPPPVQRSASDEICDIFRRAKNGAMGSESSLNRWETISTASTVEIGQTDIIATDTLKLERGYLRPNKDEKPMELRYTPTSPVSPRPWYKRNAAARENSFSRSNERKRDRDKRRVEDWMIESGIPRRPALLAESRVNVFAKMDKTDKKRRSQISILTNISELDREAAEIVQKNKEKEKALLASQGNRFYGDNNTAILNDYFSVHFQGQPSNVGQNLMSLFNSMTNATSSASTSAEVVLSENLPSQVKNDVTATGDDNKVHRFVLDEQEIKIVDVGKNLVINSEPGPSGQGKIARVTIEELDDFDKERSSKAQAIYEANRLQRFQSSVIPAIKEVSESTATTPLSTAANTANDPLPSTSPAGPSKAPEQLKQARAPISGSPSGFKPTALIVWNCPRCTLENPRWKITCDACDMWRPVPCEFKEVNPKHPLPLAVLRIVEPKDEMRQESAKITELGSDNLPTNGPGGSRNAEEKRNNFKAAKPSQALTISDLLFNTQTNFSAKDNMNIKHISNSFATGIPNDEKINNVVPKCVDESKTTHEAKVVGNAHCKPSTSASGSSISSLSSNNSDRPPWNEDVNATTKDKIEPEEIRKARLAFFEKLCSTSLPHEDKMNDLGKDHGRHESTRGNFSGTQFIGSSKAGDASAPEIKISHTEEINLNSTVSNDLQEKPVNTPKNVNKMAFHSNETPATEIEHPPKQENGIVDRKPDKSVEAQESNFKNIQTSTDIPYKSALSLNHDEDKRKLKEMLKEMKHSLPKRPKDIGKEETKEDENVSKSAVAVEDESIKPVKITNQSKPQASEKNYVHAPSDKAEMYLVESETIIEEIKVRKSPEKVSSSSQTSAIVRQISPQTNPPRGKEVTVPITVEEYNIKDGVLYTSIGKKTKKIGTGTFQLMRPRDFANIRQIKKKGGGAPVYANLATGDRNSTSAVPISNEIEKLSLQLTEPQGLAHFRAGLANSEDSNSMNTLAVNRLLRRLENAIAKGQHESAATFAKELAQMKVNCVVMRQKPETLNSQILVEMFVEDKQNHQGPFPLHLQPSLTLEQLKIKVEREYEIPCNVQRWIIGRALANNNTATLESMGITEPGSAIFLYLVAPEERTLSVTGSEEDEEELEGAVGGEPLTKLVQRVTAIGTEGNSNFDEVFEVNVKEHNVDRSTFRDPRPPRVQKEPLITAITLPAAEKEEKGWECLRCTLVNGLASESCAACGARREAAPDSDNKALQTQEKATPPEDAIVKAGGVKSRDNNSTTIQQLIDLEKTDLIICKEAFECPICIIEYSPNEGIVLRECLHVFCRGCLANTVEYSEEAEVKCPYRDKKYTCDSILLEREIKALVKPKVYEQHLAKSIALAETKIGNAFHCKTPDCKGWCIFEDNVDQFKCPVCTHTNCLTCQAIHDGLDCKQYQERINVDSEVNLESKRTKEMLQEMVDRGEAMNCPTCQVVLMKKWGCDWLRCSMCKTEICWITRGPRWGPNGKGDTSGGCQCGVNGVKCHPKCTYCH